MPTAGYEKAKASILDTQTSMFFDHRDPNIVEYLANLVRNV